MRVLIVDDERLVRYSLRSMLEEAGADRFSVVEARDAREMAAHLSERGDTPLPDVALVDIRMPGTDGISAIEAVAPTVRRRIDWIILTAQQDFSYAQRAIRIGVRDYLLKPVDPDSLLKQIEAIEAERSPLSAPVPETVSTDNPAVRAVARWTRDHLGENIGLAQAADAHNLAANYLSTLFHQETGITYTQFLTGLRMEHAREILQEEHLTVRQVAERVGYQSHRHFARRFHNHFGVYPSELRNRHQI